MKLLLFLPLILLVACSGQLETLKSAGEGSFQCPARFVSSVNQSRAFENAYKKAGKKVVFQNPIVQSELPKGFELSVLINLECVSKKSNLSFLTKAFKNLPKKDFAKYSKVEAYTVSLPSSMLSLDLERIADQDACVEGVTQETYAELQGMPNDPLYANQTYLPSIRFPEIYDDVFVSSKKLTEQYLVGVIDAGFWLQHPDLQNQWWVNPGEIPGNGIDDDNNGIIDDIHGGNLNAIPHTGDPSSANFGEHGTHVSGLIAAETNNAMGISGPMGLNVKVMAVNAWPYFVGPGGPPNSSAPMSVIDRGIRYLVDNGAQVINISMQGQGLDPNIEDAMNYAAQRNVVVVVAAGNQAEELGPYIGIPAYYTKDIEGAISALASDSANGTTTPGRCAFSNYSSTYVEIGAPGCDANIFTNYGGHGILSCVLTGHEPSGYGYIQGTSMASPVTAAGAIYTHALLKELAHIEPSAALVEEVMIRGSSVNPNLAGMTKDSKHLDLKGIYDYIQATYVNVENPPSENCQ